MNNPARTPLLRVTIPDVPDRQLSPNARVHWRTLATEKSRAKGNAKVATLHALGGVPFQDCCERFRFDFVIGWPGRRKMMDDDNAKACLKATIDGICLALGIDDKRVEVGTVTQARDSSKGAGVVMISIWETQP